MSVTSSPVAAAESTEQLLSGSSALFNQLIVMFRDGWAQPIVYWQLASVALSLILGWVFSKALTSWINKIQSAHEAEEALLPEEERSSALLESLRRLLADVCRHLGWALSSLILLGLSSQGLRLAQALPSYKLPIEALVGLMLSAYIIIRLVVYVLRQTINRDRWAKGFEKFVTGAIWILLGLQVLGILPKFVQYLDETKIPIGSNKLTLWALLIALFTVALALFVAKWLSGVVEKWIMNMGSLQVSMKFVMIRVAKILIMVVAVMAALSSVGIDLTILSVFGGAIGVGLGFGLQKIASNYVSGFIILLDRSVKIGDLVDVGGVSGTVVDIKTRYTVVKAFDGSVTIIPNEAFVTGNVKNISYTSEAGRDQVTVGVDYSADVEEAMALMKQVASSHARVLESPAPSTLLTNFGSDGIDLTLYFWVADPQKGTAGVRSDISRQILTEFRKANINIPFPQRDLRVLSVPPIVCKVETGSAS